ncbi:Fic family protein [Falsarthrobacter nasiphocae]|uniref:Fic family protein n=1 Tax=Falsarthrobacter nasiphocae TaxID=189863 RepID=A0AAE3YHJ3_9MICC|nr:Fic family protein [Falsarthrobacter nasiphocae]
MLKALVEARAALAGLNEALVSIPDPGVFVHAMSLLEARASSEIENIVTTADELFRAASTPLDASPETREALRYRSALFSGLRHMSERQGIISGPLAARICSEVRGIETRFRTDMGTFIGNPVTMERIYTPPSGERVIAEKLASWTAFVNAGRDDGLDPLVRMAAAHYQFEAIHPFPDGNGRTGRILNVLMLVSSGLLSQPVLYISQYIIGRKNEYYRLLNRVTSEGAWEDWVVFMLTAVRETSLGTLGKVKEIQSLQKLTQATAKARLGTTVPAAFVETIFRQPYSRTKNVMDACEVSRPTALRYLQAMADEGILVAENVGREKLYMNVGLMRVLRGISTSSGQR